ncbi:MAG: YicC family protein, partial [Burkholderiaceae bacterium]|nr:YicC family protein [Burkholderiaceae bacterium]
MTGFAHIQKLTQMGTLCVELRSVNSRFLELNLR